MYVGLLKIDTYSCNYSYLSLEIFSSDDDDSLKDFNPPSSKRKPKPIEPDICKVPSSDEVIKYSFLEY